MAIETFKVGVISDTHGHLDPRAKEVFEQAKVDHIIHAGDIGLPFLILDLEDIAPVTAVLGNNDEAINFKETELVELKGRKFLVHHVVDPKAPEDKIKRKIIRENPDVVVFGHTHKQFCETIGNTLYFNPGYAGKPRFKLERSVAVLICDESGITAEFTAL
jgi:putative phosphoesterase